MLLFLFSLALAQDANTAIDWTEYDRMSRTLCRGAQTREEYGALAAAQLVLVASAQLAVSSSQSQLLGLGWTVQESRLRADAQQEADALASAATIDAAQGALRTEAVSLGQWSDAMALEVSVSMRPPTSGDVPRGVLRARCNESFLETRLRVQHTVDLLLAQGAVVSNIPLDRSRVALPSEH